MDHIDKAKVNQKLLNRVPKLKEGTDDVYICFECDRLIPKKDFCICEERDITGEVFRTSVECPSCWAKYPVHEGVKEVLQDLHAFIDNEGK